MHRSLRNAEKHKSLELGLIKTDEDYEAHMGVHPAYKLANRLTMQEYVCHLTRRVVRHLDAHGRAKAAPKTMQLVRRPAFYLASG